MSGAFAGETTLVSDESTRYDLGMDATVALSVVSFALGMVTLVDVVGLATEGAALADALLVFLAVVAGGTGAVALLSYAGVTPITSRRLRGTGVGLPVSVAALAIAAVALDVTLATLLGVALLVQAVAVAAAGIASRTGVVDTGPNASAGLLAGLAFAGFGLAIGAVTGGTLVGFGAEIRIVGVGLPVPIAAALLGGAGLLAVTVLPREDLGSTLPTAVVVALFGATIVTGLVGIGWEWNPEPVSGGFTGGVVVPILALLGSLLTGWAAAKSRAGFGARGRQYGAFLVIDLNALFMVATMASIVVFVLSKGVTYVLHGFTVGALSLAVLLSPVLVLALGWARAPAGTDEWHSGARQLLRVLPVAAVGAVYAGLAWLLATGTDLAHEYQYTVLVDRTEERLDTVAAITPEFTVGAWVLGLPALLLFAYFRREADRLPDDGARADRFQRVRAAIPLASAAIVLFAGALSLFGKTPLGLPVADTLGAGVVVAAAVGVLALAVLPLLALALGGSIAERAVGRPAAVSTRLYGGLVVLGAAVVLEPAAAAVPGIGGVDLIPAVAIAGAGVALLTAVAVVRAREGATDARDRRILAAQTMVGLAAAAGFVALLGVHVALTGSRFGVGGLAIANAGSLSWPFAMERSLPLAPDGGGIFPAIVGTVWLVVGASLFAVPLGLGAAVFLTEYADGGRFTALVETATNALWSTPSVVFGLFGFAFLVPRINGDLSLLSGMLVLGFMLLPLVLITSREAIKSVPGEYRDASAALGVGKWETVRSVVLPAAMPGVITGIILGVGRIAGETAPLILVLGSRLSAPGAVDVIGGFRFLAEPPFIVNEALLAKPPALPTGIWAVIAAGVSGSTSKGWATAFVLLAVVLSFYAVGIASRTYFRRKLDRE